MGCFHIISFVIVCMPYVYLAHTEKMCSKFDDLPQLKKTQRLPGKKIFSTMTDGVMLCARLCLKTSLCGSFNFNIRTGVCELNDVTLGTEASDLIHATDYVFSEVSSWPKRLAGVCVNHTCLESQYCQPKNNGDYSCKPLVIPTSCADIKECDPSSTDGEYWIRLANFDLYRTRIYCHNMATDNSLEYLTLPTPNYGVFPNVSNRYCQRDTSLEGNCVGKSGETWYNKIRVIIETMEILRNDSTFAFFSNLEADFASVRDCYSIHRNNVISPCGTRGRFTINLTDTGWVVPSNQQWQIADWKAIVESVTQDDSGSVVHIKCGGFGGGCDPVGPMLLKPYPEADVNESSAKEVMCFL